MRVLGHVIIKEILQLRRDRKMIPILLGSPILQLIVLGYAANLDVSRIPLLIVDRDRTQASRELCERFLSSNTFVLAGETEDLHLVEQRLVQGKAKIALVIREGYGADVAVGRAPEVQVLTDGSEGNLSLLGLNYASVIIQEESSDLIVRRLGDLKILAQTGSRSTAAGPASFAAGSAVRRGEVPPGRCQLVSRVWYNPDLRSRWFFVPAILAMVLMLTTMVLPSMAVVREKEIGTLEQIMVTPIRPWQLIVGKLSPFGVMGLLTILFITGLAVFYFGVPLRGSLLLLFLLTALFLLTTLGLGLLASTLVKNQQQAMLVSIFLLQVPMIYLSGLIFPIENMPRIIQYGTYAIPLRYYTTIIRGIFLKGAGVSALWREMVVLLAYGVAILGLASSRFRKRLD